MLFQWRTFLRSTAGHGDCFWPVDVPACICMLDWVDSETKQAAQQQLPHDSAVRHMHGTAAGGCSTSYSFKCAHTCRSWRSNSGSRQRPAPQLPPRRRQAAAAAPAAAADAGSGEGCVLGIDLGTTNSAAAVCFFTKNCSLPAGGGWHTPGRRAAFQLAACRACPACPPVASYCS